MMEEAASQLERDHVHNVYDKIAPYFNDSRYKAWPKVRQFLLDLPPGSIVADIGGPPAVIRSPQSNYAPLHFFLLLFSLVFLKRNKHVLSFQVVVTASISTSTRRCSSWGVTFVAPLWILPGAKDTRSRCAMGCICLTETAASTPCCLLQVTGVNTCEHGTRSVTNHSLHMHERTCCCHQPPQIQLTHNKPQFTTNLHCQANSGKIINVSSKENRTAILLICGLYTMFEINLCLILTNSCFCHSHPSSVHQRASYTSNKGDGSHSACGRTHHDLRVGHGAETPQI